MQNQLTRPDRPKEDRKGGWAVEKTGFKNRGLLLLYLLLLRIIPLKRRRFSGKLGGFRQHLWTHPRAP